MLRVGLTGGLGSGKSTAAAMLAERGAHVLSADAIGRELMQPGTSVFAAIVHTFGPGVVEANGELDRRALARLAFADGRVEELNAIVHPPAIARQAELATAIGREDPRAIVVVESALIFETRHTETKHTETRHTGDRDLPGKGWQGRFDVLVLVTAPAEVKVARFVERSGALDRPAAEAEARRRLAQMLDDAEKAPLCDFVLTNDGTVEDLQAQVDMLWTALLARRDQAAAS